MCKCNFSKPLESKLVLWIYMVMPWYDEMCNVKWLSRYLVYSCEQIDLKLYFYIRIQKKSGNEIHKKVSTK